jgi:toxin FitB
LISHERARFLLDTNVPSETLRPLPNPSVTAWVEAHSDVQVVSVVSIGELRRGATLQVQGSARRLQLEHYIEIKIPLLFGKRILPLTQAIAERWGVLDARRQTAGQPLGIADGMIAATAIEHNLTLVTRNVKDFAGLGATIFNPWET